MGRQEIERVSGGQSKSSYLPETPVETETAMTDSHTLLVAGMRNVEAGKTTFATGLVEYLGGIGVKPRAGNDYWYDYDTVMDGVQEGRLLGKDAKRLAAVSTDSLRAETINPMHRLWRPIPAGEGSIFGRENAEFLVDRVDETFVVNQTVDMPSELEENLALSSAATVTSLREMNRLMADRHQPSLEGVQSIIHDHEQVVVESYADVARPIQHLDVDAVAVVGAGTVELYDGERYGRAADVASGSANLGQLEERVDDVTALIEPLERTTLPPLRREERIDPPTVAKSYESAYRALLEAAST